MTVIPLGWLATSDRHVISCREYAEIDVDSHDVLGPDGRLTLAPGILNRYVSVDFVNHKLRLVAKGIAGLIPITDQIAIRVEPRFPVRNLTHMVTTCGYSPTALAALREYKTTDKWSEWMCGVLTDGLLAAMGTIAVNGLLRSYHRRTEISSYPHGRIDATATMLHNSARSIHHRAQYSWFERTIDNAPNRCLKSAVTLLHAKYLHGPRTDGVRERIARLGNSMRMLHEVALEGRPFSVDDSQVRGVTPLPEARSYYRPALELAVAVLTGRGIDLDQQGDDLCIPSLLIKTEDLFEEFVRITLQGHFSNHPTLMVLNGKNHPGRVALYEPILSAQEDTLPNHATPSSNAEKPSAEPDVVFRTNDGSHPLVADVKYTKVRDYTNRSEVEQITVYGLRYGSRIAMTIHPKSTSNKRGLHVVGRIGSLLITQYRVDLGADDLEAEMVAMAECVEELITPTAGANLAGA